MYNFEELRVKVETALQAVAWQRNPQSLYDPIQYTLKARGKRVRPVLTLLAANLWQSAIKSTHLNPALGLEIFHNFTLLHDDLMDNSSHRRGKETVHIKWDANQAILSGDAMQIVAFQYMLRCEDKYQRQIHDLFSLTALEVCEGQQLDVEFETRMNVSKQEYLEMIKLKTAVLLACSLKVGAITANAPEKDANLLYEFGINMGIGFQLQDDYLDVFGETKTFGKNVGTDIVNNKKTMLLITALEEANQSQRQELLYWLDGENVNPEEKIQAVTHIFKQLGIAELTHEMILQYHQNALACLKKVQLPEEKKVHLANFAQMLNQRNS